MSSFWMTGLCFTFSFPSLRLFNFSLHSSVLLDFTNKGFFVIFTSRPLAVRCLSRVFHVLRRVDLLCSSPFFVLASTENLLRTLSKASKVMVNKLEGSPCSRLHSASTRKTKAKFQTVYVHSTVVFLKDVLTFDCGNNPLWVFLGPLCFCATYDCC